MIAKHSIKNHTQIPEASKKFRFGRKTGAMPGEDGDERTHGDQRKKERIMRMTDEIPQEVCPDEAGGENDSVPRVIVEMERRRARRKFKLCGAGVLLLGGGLLFCINDGALQDKVSLLSGCVSLFGFFMLFGYKWMLRLQIRKSLKILLKAAAQGSAETRGSRLGKMKI